MTRMSTETLVLIVEDDPLIGEHICTWLAEAGYRPVGPARSVTEAKAAIADHALGAALLDIHLGGDDRSFELADILGALHVPFAFLSAYSSVLTPRKFRDAPHLMKPFSGEDLAALLHRLVGTPPTEGA
jgi:DNA-binding response OmpR family regulator